MPMAGACNDFASLEREGWQRVAAKYEQAWSGLTRLFIPPLLEAAAITPGARLLDVACGPGYVAEAARATGARPIGVDFSIEMVRLAQKRSPDLEFRLGDAQALDFPDHSFDVVLMNFGLLHVPQPQAALAEAHRVLRPRGRFGFTVWAGPEESPGARIIDEALKAHADMNVPVPKGPDYFGYSHIDQCRENLARCGFDPDSLIFRTVQREWEVPSASFLFEAEKDAGVRTAALLARQKPEALDTIRNQIEMSVRAYPRGRAFAIPFVAHIVVVTAGAAAVKPE
jgi:ubiquinone/menaquinone biosynthesis C-methylase UbiE